MSRRRARDDGDVAAVVARVRDVAGGFEADGLPVKTRKSIVVRGTARGRRVVAKSLASEDEPWRWYFEREVSLYERFIRERPPVRAPELVAADRERGVLVLEDVGEPLSEQRWPADPVDDATAEELVEICVALGRWERGLALAPADVPTSAVVRTMRARLLEDPSAPSAWIVDGVERCRRLGILDDGVAEAATTILRRHCAPVFAHGDLLLRNVAKGTGPTALIDWECAGAHARTWDAALLWFALSDAWRQRLEQTLPYPELGAMVAFALAREIKIRTSTFPARAGDPTLARLRSDLARVGARLRSDGE